MQNDISNSLLPKWEFQYFIKNENNYHSPITKNFEYNIRSNVRKKLKILLKKELPLRKWFSQIKIYFESQIPGSKPYFALLVLGLLEKIR